MKNFISEIGRPGICRPKDSEARADKLKNARPGICRTRTGRPEINEAETGGIRTGRPESCKSGKTRTKVLVRQRLTMAMAFGALLTAGACDNLFRSEEQGILEIVFPQEIKTQTKAFGTVPDTNDFLIKVTDAKGATVFEGDYGSTPEQLFVDPGTYTIRAVSCEFNEPLYDCPQYGDNQVVRVTSGATTTVNLSCYQLNSGIQLKIDYSFIAEYPSGILYLKSAEGTLMYGYNETRTAFFKPGNVSLLLSDAGRETALTSRTLQEQQILVLGISAAENGSQTGGGKGIQISIDTTRTWINDSYILGGTNKGDDTESAFSVSQARAHVGEEDVWVLGYIVGGDLSSSKCSFTPPFNSRTNLVIANKSSCKDKENCLSVQLAKGDIRDELNLVDNEGNLGRQIYLKGEIVESYYGIVGMQNISEYKWK